MTIEKIERILDTVHILTVAGIRPTRHALGKNLLDVQSHMTTYRQCKKMKERGLIDYDESREIAITIKGYQWIEYIDNHKIVKDKS